MKAIIKLIPILAIVFLAACEKEVEVNLPKSDSKIVLNCIMSEDSLFSVSVTRTKKLYTDDNASIIIENAVVALYENNVFKENLPYVAEGVYTSKTFRPTNGNKYKVVVKANGFKDAYAEEELIKQATISDVNFKDSVYSNQNDTYGVVSFMIDDPKTVSNYYELEVDLISYIPDFGSGPGSGNPPTDSIRMVYPTFMLIKDEALKENYTPSGIDGETDYGTDVLQFSDKFIDGKNYKVEAFISSSSLDYSDSMMVKIKSVSKSYYEYKRTVLQQGNVGPFSEPVKVFTNVVGGTGILGSYSQVKKYIIK
jgi:hypothetical protein